MFESEEQLAHLVGNWPGARLVEVWNGLPGVRPVRRFTNRKMAAERIWQRGPGRWTPARHPDQPGGRKTMRVRAKRDGRGTVPSTGVKGSGCSSCCASLMERPCRRSCKPRAGRPTASGASSAPAGCTIRLAQQLEHHSLLLLAPFLPSCLALPSASSFSSAWRAWIRAGIQRLDSLPDTTAAALRLVKRLTGRTPGKPFHTSTSRAPRPAPARWAGLLGSKHITKPRSPPGFRAPTVHRSALHES